MMRRLATTLAVLALATPAADAADGGVTADGAWARAPAGAGNTMALYLTLHGGEQADRLTGIETAIADMAMLHESADENGVSVMRMLDGLDVPARATVVLRPGGLHVMLEGLSQRPSPGATIRVRLRFAHAPAVELPAAVRPPGAPGP